MNAMMMRYRADEMIGSEGHRRVGTEAPVHPGAPSILSRMLKELAAALKSGQRTLQGMAPGPSQLDQWGT